jgi:thioredoxin-like negative regulator of GroEL
VPVLRQLLAEEDDRSIRLVLARTLRDMTDVPAASVEYGILSAATPDDEDLTLEWARALAWAESYGEAAGVLEGALERAPDSVPLRIELARFYYYDDRLTEARSLLASLGPDVLARCRPGRSGPGCRRRC